MLVKVPTIRTTFSQQDFVNSLVQWWSVTFSQLPQKESIGCIFAQWGIETGLSAACFNFNIGNIKAADIQGQVVEYCALNNVWEVVNGQRVNIPPDNPGAWFRSFPDLTSGIAFYISFLHSPRYQLAWAAIENGDLADFVHQLKVAGYYTAGETAYLKGAQYYFNIFANSQLYDNAINLVSLPVMPPDYQPVDNIDQPVIQDVFPATDNSTPSGWRSIVNKIKSLF